MSALPGCAVRRLTSPGRRARLLAAAALAAGWRSNAGCADGRSAYAEDGLVYAYYTSASDHRIVRCRVGGEEEIMLDGIDKAGIHDGGRLASAPDGLCVRRPTR